MAHLWCAISIWYTNGTPHRSAPLVTFFQKFFLIFFNFFQKIFKIFLISVHYGLISGQIALRGQTSRKVTHPHTTPAQARLTSEFYPTPATAHFTGTC